MYICSIINVIYYYWSYEAKKICKIYLAKMSTCVILVARKEKISFYVQYKLSSHHSFTKLLRLNPVSCLRSYMCGPFCKWVKIGSNAINFFTKIQHVDLPPYWNAKIGPHNDVDGTVLKCLSNEKYSMYVRNNYRFFAIDVVLICAFCSSLHGSSPVQWGAAIVLCATRNLVERNRKWLSLFMCNLYAALLCKFHFHIIQASTLGH